jgi:RecJ-like exonuclease
MKFPTINVVFTGFGMDIHLTITDDRVTVDQVLTATGESNGVTNYTLAAFQDLLVLGNPHVKTLETCEYCWGRTHHELNHVCGSCWLDGHGRYYSCDDCHVQTTERHNLVCDWCLDQRIRDKESMEWLGDDSEREDA